MREAAVERALVREGERRGCWVLKAEGLIIGFPDRMILAPDGRVSFVELKRPRGRLRPAQRLVRRWLGRLGFHVPVLDSPEAAVEFYRRWLG